MDVKVRITERRTREVMYHSTVYECCVELVVPNLNAKNSRDTWRSIDEDGGPSAFWTTTTKEEFDKYVPGTVFDFQLTGGGQ